MTINSLIAMLTFADFGIGNGLMNAISHCAGKDDREGARRYVSSAFFVLLAIACVFTAIFFASYPFISWTRIFNVHSALAARESGPSVAVFIASFLISLPLGIVQRIQFGYQEGFINNFWTIGASIAGLAGLILAIHLHGSLPWLIGAIVGTPVLALAANNISLFKERPWLRPRWMSFSREASREVLGAGLMFFVLQLAMAIGYQSDNLVIAQVLGVDSVTQYAIPLKLFQLIPTVSGLFMFSLWPAYGEAMARGDVSWIKRTYLRSLRLLAISVIPGALILTVIATPLIHLWVGRSITPTALLLVGLTLGSITNSFVGPISAFMNGTRLLMFQVVSWSLMAATNLGISIFLTKKIGLSGVVYGSVISQTVFILIPSFWYISRFIKKLEAQTRNASA
ncbi:MAG: oligosaccharide flippase family protein [Edaphobacter sp.]|uniref:oligosaccharide flippase family protein n=1 Tax=Edaphobacter sp. TaxID=1934404 RepID=UPI0023A1609C|nr:oligosaccharide flippase family protein [Edaphobacter sp.]MDE1176980.1 oligosaccharide flippase family protein [Edaphobacter sp.]